MGGISRILNGRTGKGRLRFAAAFTVLLLSGTALAQTNPTLTEAERGIRGDDSDRATALSISEMAVDAHVTGRTADVTLTMMITSNSPVDFEGNLSLALPADAVVTGYALDVGGRMIPGQLIEQPRARNLYENEVRRGIDPGLAEVTAENRFTTRIFPIRQDLPRRFSISFSAPFDPDRGIDLPLLREHPIGQISAALKVDGYSTAPDIRFAGAPIALHAEGASFAGTASLNGQRLTGGLVITGGSLSAPMLITRHDSGDRFFLIGDDAQVPGNAGPARGGRLRIYWDRSLSHRDDPLEREISALTQLVDSTAPAAIDLVTFSSDAPQHLRPTDKAALQQQLEAVTYRGATSFAGLNDLRLPAADRCVLVSDGQVTIDRMAGFTPDCTLMVISASATADGARLARMAHKSGGQFLRLTEGAVEDTVARMARPAAGITAVRDGAGRPIDYRMLPAAHGQWRLAGPLPANGVVRVTRQGRGEQRYAAGNAAPIASAAPAALWAVQRISELSDNPVQHDDMAAMARRYRVAGPRMSFLVLETPEQYLNADITPPDGFSKDWLARYQAGAKEHARDKADERSNRLAYVLREWEQRRAWWNTDFAARKRTADREERQRSTDETVAMAPMAPPPPPPAPPPPPPAPVVNATANAEAYEADRAVVVTGTAVRRPDSNGSTANASIRVDLAEMPTDRPYLAALQAAPEAQRLAVLADQEIAWGTTPAFYFDVADWFRNKGDQATAMQLLLSALELTSADDETRQIVAFRLERDRAFNRAVELSELIAAANAEFRPQPLRDLALVLAARGTDEARNRNARRADLERAFTLLTDTALNPASGAFDGIEVIALMEANALIPQIKAAGGNWTLDPRLVALTDTDARIVISWSLDDADVDLWVTEPDGERVYYSHKLSANGGLISNDMTDGYGPEEYLIRRALAGAYKVQIDGYAGDRLNPNGSGRVMIRLQRNFARPGQQQQLVDLDIGFGRNTREERNRPVATLTVGQ